MKASDLEFSSPGPGTLPKDDELREVFQCASARTEPSELVPEDESVFVESDDSIAHKIRIKIKPTMLVLCPRCRLMAKRDNAADTCERCLKVINELQG